MKKARTMFSMTGCKTSQRGSMLVEMLLSVALAAIIIPFVFRYQHNVIARAKNIEVAQRMETVQTALERYIVENRASLLNTVGRNITRVQLADLVPYGLPEDILNSSAEYQLRILKSNDVGTQSTLQGVVVMSDANITPLRTREIVMMGGNNMGFIEGRHAYGAFGAWRSDTVDLGLGGAQGIVGSTGVNRDNALYLWRVPSNDADDATMMSALNLGGHDIENASFFDVSNVNFSENMHSGTLVASNIIFQNRTTIDTTFETKSARVAGALSADSRTMEISGALKLDDLGKFSSFSVEDLWVGNLSLSGLTVNSDEDVANLKINQTLDMTGGRISALYATVGFSGSITPRLVVTNLIEDSINPEYFWDADWRAAHFFDVSFPNLNDMATRAVAREGDKSTASSQLFGAVVANKNATAADFMNALLEIESRVRAKYRLLNLE